MKDVGITQDQFNVGQQMLSLGIVLFEIPSNMILYRVGPGKWLTLQLFFFGTVSTFQAFQNSYGSFIATRFLLGVSESGESVSVDLGGFKSSSLVEPLSRVHSRWTLDAVNLVHARRDGQACHVLLLWQSVWPSVIKASGLRNPAYARCRWQARMVLVVCSDGRIHHRQWSCPRLVLA